MSIVGL